jgi:2-polyprenyl-3-methyl-5-hydroxy-6-metoxy-1,4-benzoquinol methylase
MDVTADNFKITDSCYGITLPLYRCLNCGFIQATTINVLKFYQELQDDEYIKSSQQRKRQFEGLIRQTKGFIQTPLPKVLDIGSGVGMFVDVALRSGWTACGIEPSQWLAEHARQRGIPVVNGVFPHEDCRGPYDAIFLVDVIEHLEDPLSIVKALPSHLDENGVVVIVTPNVSSFMAKIMGRRWWHYRIAHIGYYNRVTLTRLMANGDLEPIKFLFAKWYFRGDYLLERLFQYIPFLENKKSPAFLKNVTLPLNLFDSFVAVFRKTALSGIASRPGASI